ncbi:MAG TPA: long-chain fatty acid--CoA ligase [Verrucomicrobiota bacterium]|nr:long-chain fatty acid--CoA ligase [Verrucomicrobiota bacterium]HNT15142.1 long-chain fatty acid--CoA ligase [Verrucomicrobiota bacterium]
MNLSEAFAHSAQLRSGKIALYWDASEFTFATLWAQSVGVAAELAGKFNVQPGDRVGLWLKNRPEFVPAYFGILTAGAAVVPINNFLKPPEVRFLLEDAGIDLLITDEELGGAAATLAAGRPSLQVARVETLTAFTQPPSGTIPALPAAARQRAESDLAVIIYTSGTTGKPKGAMLSHGNLLHNVAGCQKVLEALESDRYAVFLPLFHSYMMTVGMLLPLLVGGSMVLIKSLNQPQQMLREMYQRQATVLPAIPQFYRTLTHAHLPARLPFRLCVSGAAPLPVQVLKDFEAKHQIPLIEGYGLSEASPVVSKNPLHAERKPGSIGLPLPNLELTIQDDDGRILGPNETGELCVRGGNVMLGYWNNPAETARALRNGWLLTGDIGYRDAEGYFFITDRKKDMLLVNGINVYPREVEEVIYQFPGVKEAAVIGVTDPRKGEQPVAYVATTGDAPLDEPALVRFLRERLAAYKVPRHITVLPALPRNATGKILKTELRKLAGA